MWILQNVADYCCYFCCDDYDVDGSGHRVADGCVDDAYGCGCGTWDGDHHNYGYDEASNVYNHFPDGYDDYGYVVSGVDC